jgi:hypothetical protein
MAVTEQEWHAWRTEPGVVTASVVAAAHTDSYGGMAAVVAKRLGRSTDTIDPKLAERGHAWEPRIAAMTEAATGLRIIGEQQLMEASWNRLYRATVDGFATSDDGPLKDLLADASSDLALFEAKTRSTEARGPAPWAYYRAQCQWGMMVSGLDRALLAVAFIDSDGELDDYKKIWVCADRDEQGALVNTAEEIARFTDMGVIPSAKSWDKATAFTAGMSGATVVDDREWFDRAERLAWLHDEIGALQTEADLIEGAWLTESVNRGVLISAGEFTVKHKPANRMFNETAARVAHPECVVTVEQFDRKQLSKKDTEAFMVASGKPGTYKLERVKQNG